MSSCLMFGKCNRGWSDAYTVSEAASVKEEDIFDKALKARDNPVLAAMFDTSSWRDE